MNNRLNKEQVENLLKELKDPVKAKQFLMNAGLIDQSGQLTKPYQTQPGD